MMPFFILLYLKAAYKNSSKLLIKQFLTKCFSLFRKYINLYVCCQIKLKFFVYSTFHSRAGFPKLGRIAPLGGDFSKLGGRKFEKGRKGGDFEILGSHFFSF